MCCPSIHFPVIAPLNLVPVMLAVCSECLHSSRLFLATMCSLPPPPLKKNTYQNLLEQFYCAWCLLYLPESNTHLFSWENGSGNCLHIIIGYETKTALVALTVDCQKQQCHRYCKMAREHVFGKVVMIWSGILGQSLSKVLSLSRDMATDASVLVLCQARCLRTGLGTLSATWYFNKSGAE